ncbi:MAG: CotH kinase family protein, partial [Saprospiraceae bacterium]|nr:CotH kinase family protein [Saprospiraceae bacterium]
MQALFHIFWSRKSAILACCLSASMTLVAQTVHFSTPSGFYPAPVSLSLSTGAAGHQIRFTTNGSAPDAASQLYASPIPLPDRSPQPNGSADIPTNPPSIYEGFRWRPPLGLVPKATVVTAAVFEGDEQEGEALAEEYFIGPSLDSITLPIASIWADSAGLFGYEQGIYVPGKDYDDNPTTWQPGNYFNEGPEWERPATLSFYEGKNLLLRQPFELKIHGGGSRMMPCKSLRLSAKAGLGAALFEHPFFENRPHGEHKRLVLRNGGQDFVRTLLANVLMQALLADADIETQAARPVVVFLNGTYWGIHSLTERYDKYYLANYHEADLDEIDLVEIAMSYQVKEGSSADYEAMIASLVGSDLSDPAQFEAIAAQLDLENFTDNH